MLEPATETSAPETPAPIDQKDREYLSGAFAPVIDEIDVGDLPVRGTLPPELNGTYVRNGPNPALAPTGTYTYPFDGDGMLHAITFDRGHVRYRNRWVVTQALAAERRAGRALYGGVLSPFGPDINANGSSVSRSPFKNCSNANVVAHANRVLSLGDNGLPYELTNGFGTIGEFDADTELLGMTSHPKLDPIWDELCFFRYDLEIPYLTYGVLGPRGRVTETTQIDIPRPVLMHDFGVTDQHVVFFDSPAVLDPGAVARGERIVEWQEDYGTRIGVMPRDGDTGSMRWFPVDNRFVMHVMNAYTKDKTVIIDYIHRRAFRPDQPDSPEMTPRLFRTAIDLGRGSVTDEVLDSHVVELPTIDPRRAGLDYRFGYVAAVTHGGSGPAGADFDALLRYDFRSEGVTEHRFPEGVVVGEPQFIPRPGGTDDGDGWVLALTYDTTRGASELVVIAAERFGGPPVAEIPLPRRVPAGLHGTWLPAPETT